MRIPKEYKSSYYLACIDLIRAYGAFLCGNFILYYGQNSKLVYLFLPLMALLNLKLFMPFHDCIHNSYTPNTTLNRIIGTINGILTCTSSLNWGLDHRTHHSTNGNINNKYNYPFNETIYITYIQYDKLNGLIKKIVKLLLHPIIRFTILPLVYYGILQRFMYIVKKIKYKDKIKSSIFYICMNNLINNAGIFILLFLIRNLGYLHLYLLYIWQSHIIGFLLFTSQHTFNPAYIVEEEDFNLVDSGIHGSSFIQIPESIKWFFGGIEYHNLHHMNTQIPSYNLRKYHDDIFINTAEFRKIVTLSMYTCYINLWLVVYDEHNRKYITITEAENRK